MPKRRKKTETRGKKPTPARRGYVGTIAALGAEFGASTYTMAHWRTNGAPMERTAHGYAVEPLRAWVRENRELVDRRRKPQDTEAIDREYDAAKALQKRYQARLARLEYRHRVGELISKEEMKSRDVARIVAVKRGLLSLPKSVAHEIVGRDPREVEVILTRKVRDLLERFRSL